MQKLYNTQNRIDYYRQKIMFTVCPYMKNYYAYLIRKETAKAKILISKEMKAKMQQNRNEEPQKEFTLEELSKHNGANGKSSYVAVDGIVYDVSLSPTWGGGTHFGIYAGKDLTNMFKACHEGDLEVLRNLPKIGVIKK